jgi:predicted amidohydrolase
MKDFLKIGLIQPVIDPGICWNESEAFIKSEKLKKKTFTPYKLNIDCLSAERVWQEIKEGLRLLIKSDNCPEIILIPELHLPISKVNEIKAISKKHNVMIIAGIDFQRNPTDHSKIRNRGIISIPNNWGKDSVSTRLTCMYYGKTYFTYMERNMFKNIEGFECNEDPEQNMYIFKTKDFGNFGIMICSDIFDIERMMLYQTKIHHLFIISLNMDLNTYFAMSETLTRLLYCNVVICNTGHFGGSLAVSPYADTNERTIYKYQGQKMFNTQLIDIPVKSLDEAQKFDFALDDKKKKNIKFKASPPGYFDKINSRI